MLKRLLRPLFYWSPRRCVACGHHSRRRYTPVMWKDLGDQWELSDQAYRDMDRREGVRCTRCWSNLRSLHLAQIILEKLNARYLLEHSSLAALAADSRLAHLTVAEINSAGSLHPFLQNFPRLCFSEYGSLDPAIPSEDITELSYADQSFDIVLTSEVLEHVPDVARAFREIRRVLKPDGMHIFTIPVLWNRKSRRRAMIDNGELFHILPPSYHGNPEDSSNDLLVFYEFGYDITNILEENGFKTEIYRYEKNSMMTVFVSKPI